MEALQDAIGTGSVDQAEMLGRLIRRVADLEAAISQSARLRRELHNQLVELRGNVSCNVTFSLSPSPLPGHPRALLLVLLPLETSFCHVEMFGGVC
jgi:hypothetical protein